MSRIELWARQYWGWLAGAALVVAATAPAIGEDGPTLCPFALATGIACPGCGLTRAAGAVLTGDLPGAIGFHPMIFVVAAWSIGWILSRATGARWRPQMVNYLLAATGVLFIVTWFARLLGGQLPSVG